MKYNLKKEKFIQIENAFSVLKESSNSQAGLKIIKDSLESCFDYKFDVRLITGSPKGTFVFSVFPTTSTTDKIIASLMKGDDKTFMKIWEQNKEWIIEIDSNILTMFTEKELTAMLLHEVGHVVCSNSVPYRISNVLKYEIAKSSMANKIMAQDNIFSSVLSLPILNACICDSHRDSNMLKKEIQADKFAKSMGYQMELASALKKLMNSNICKANGTMQQNMQDGASLSLSLMDQFRMRRDKLVKETVSTMLENCSSPYMQNQIIKITNSFYGNDNQTNYFHEYTDKLVEEGYYTEFFGIKKGLDKIDPATFDYVDTKITSIRNADDKMMLITYIHTKLDIIDYYIHILDTPKIAKKYSVPYTRAQLINMQNRLLQSRRAIIDYKIPPRDLHMKISWPEGYEG